MRFKNAMVFLADEGFVRAGFAVENGVFREIRKGEGPEDGMDLQGQYVIPGLIDIHTHGNSGADFSDGDYEGLKKMARYLAENGVTGFAPASMTLPYEVLETAYLTAKRLRDEKPEGCAALLGINMEGPFFSEKKKGAQNGAYLRLPDAEAVNRQLVDIFDKAGVPVILLDSDIVCAPERSQYDVVSVNHLDVGRRLAQHLRRCGATRIVYLTQKDRAPCVQARQLGVKIGCEGLLLDGKAVYADPEDVDAIRRMLRRLRPDSVVCYNDRQAALLLQTLDKLGRKVPDDIMVVGFDDVQYARLTIPQLTTMRQPCKEIAAAVFRMLMERVRNPNLPARMEILDSKLTVRGSTK